MKTPSSIPLAAIEEGDPPEELLALYAGGLGQWQIWLVFVTSISVFFHGFDVFSSKVMTPIISDYHCIAENSSQCFYSNGSKCKEFVFTKKIDFANLHTFTEKVSRF